MSAALLALALTLPQDAGRGDWLDWARAIDEADLSLSWGKLGVEFRGELSLRAFVFGDEAPGITVEEAALRADHYDPREEVDSPEFGGRFHLFLEGYYGEALEFTVEIRADRAIGAEEGEGVGARFEQYWLRWGPFDDPVPRLQAGKFAAPVGNFLGRHESSANPLTTFPLPYDHVTSFLSLRDAPARILARRDSRRIKLQRVPIWQEVYAPGVMAFANAGDFGFAAALMNSAPASWPYDWTLDRDDFHDPRGYLRASWAPHAGTRVGASWARGPHTREDDDRSVPPGVDAGDFDQTLAGIDFAFSAGHFDLFAELYFSRFEAPFVDDLDLWTAYVEAKYTFMPGLFGAARLGTMRFGKIEDAAGEDRHWDRDVMRYEVGSGYYFTRNLFVKATLQVNDQLGGDEKSDNLFIVELVLQF